MFEVKTIARSQTQYTRDSTTEIRKVFRNRNPSVHPFQKAREYKRALNAVKLEKMFAKPFIGALEGHSDGVYCTATSKTNLVQFFSGACDGEIRVWDLAFRKCVWSVYGHSGFVNGLTVSNDGEFFFSCGTDKIIKMWKVGIAENKNQQPTPINTYFGEHPLFSIDHHWTENKFITAGETVEVWDTLRSTPITSYEWGADSILCARFNPSETNIFASTSSDRGIVIYDIRAPTPLRKTTLQMKSNKLAWNPYEPYHFVVANEDHNLYTFDMRNLRSAKMIHKDHVSAVMDVAFSPTGREFASGSFDRTVRIFEYNSGRSREVYHGKRMQRLFCVNFSPDAKYVLTGSDDTNIRIWKAQASKTLAPLPTRAERAINYREELKHKFEHLPEVRRISKFRHVPKEIFNAKKKNLIMKEAEKRKIENMRKNKKSKKIRKQPERKAVVVREEV